MASSQSLDPSTSAPDQEHIFQQLENYDFDSDSEFQSGLQSILSTSTSSSSEKEQLILRAKCFYLSRKLRVLVDIPAYKAWRERPENSQPLLNEGEAPNSAPSGASEMSDVHALSTHEARDTMAPYPTSFSEIVELISSGKPIPGIKEIPGTVLEGRSSQSTAQGRPKPWERAATVQQEAAKSD